MFVDTGSIVVSVLTVSLFFGLGGMLHAVLDFERKSRELLLRQLQYHEEFTTQIVNDIRKRRSS